MVLLHLFKIFLFCLGNLRKLFNEYYNIIRLFQERSKLEFIIDLVALCTRTIISQGTLSSFWRRTRLFSSTSWSVFGD
jgi:hypothetical protein